MSQAEKSSEAENGGFVSSDVDAPILKSIDEQISESEIESLKVKHKEIVVVNTMAGVAVFKKLSRAEFRRYQAMIFSDKDRSMSAEYVARAACVYPAIGDFDKMLDVYPAIVTGCSDKVLKLSGAQGDDLEAKKY